MITRRWIGVLTALLLGVTDSFAQDGGSGERPPATGAKAQLDAAQAIVDGLKGVKGPERLDGMRDAARAFEAVEQEFASDAVVVARAAWEAGECWRRASELEPAAAAYGRVLAGVPGRYEQRAAFERASMLRRLKRYDDALELYAAAGRIAADGVRAHDARIWVARVHELRGDPDAALAAYRAAVDAAVGARRTIEACDACAKALIRRGELDEARAVILRADAAAEPEIELGGDEAARLTRALEEMGARRQLQRAVDKAQDAGGDAVRLERDRGR